MRHASGPPSALALLKETSTDLLKPGVVAARSKFYITIVVLSVATYTAAFVAYWLVRSRQDDSTAEISPGSEEHLKKGKNEKSSVGGGKGPWMSGIFKSMDNPNSGIFKRKNAEKKKKKKKEIV
jgi:hypothetical protein